MTTGGKHRCARFHQIRDGFLREIGQLSPSDTAEARWKERAEIQIASLKRRMSWQLNKHLGRCRECDR